MCSTDHVASHTPLLPSGRRFTRFNNATDLIAALGPIAASKQETALGTLLAPVALGISSCCGTLGACNLGVAVTCMYPTIQAVSKLRHRLAKVLVTYPVNENRKRICTHF